MPRSSQSNMPNKHLHATAHAGTERGLAARSEVRADISELITQLEARNPTSATAEDLNRLSGKWKLAYTSNSELLAILALSRLPGLEVGDITQAIDATTMVSSYIVHIHRRTHYLSKSVRNVFSGILSRSQLFFGIFSLELKNIVYVYYTYHRPWWTLCIFPPSNPLYIMYIIPITYHRPWRTRWSSASPSLALPSPPRPPTRCARPSACRSSSTAGPSSRRSYWTTSTSPRACRCPRGRPWTSHRCSPCWRRCRESSEGGSRRPRAC